MQIERFVMLYDNSCSYSSYMSQVKEHDKFMHEE